MSDHELPRTLSEAKARGYERITDLKAFLEERLGLSLEEFKARHHNFAASDGADCAHDPEGTPCYSECHEEQHIGIFGACGPNGTCDLYQGPC
ncbi:MULTISPECIES: hypothetical protein [unclassified Novosphingobium]|nr:MULTISPECIES: hypothetical protein [unclassified Novosphingobium]MBB3476579.1 hypothetical protein [Novosphingobium sp. BK369]MBB3619190.1 hypothetical protein [Novosphingobium sp. BK592]NOX04207.1 hypothetical protein [Novosphingobium sp. SG754]